MWPEEDGHESGQSRWRTSHRSHMSFSSHPAAARWQSSPYISVTCFSVAVGLPHSAHTCWAGLGCPVPLPLPAFTACLSSLYLPRGILILCLCKPIRHCFFTRTYWLILFGLLPSGRALLFVKLLNYQWGLGSSNEADLTTRSIRSITREFQMSTFYIFRTESIVNHCVRLLCRVKVCRI